MSETSNLRSTEDDPEDASPRYFYSSFRNRLPDELFHIPDDIPSIIYQLRSARLSSWDNLKPAPINLTPGSGNMKMETLVDENPDLKVGNTTIRVSELRAFVSANASHIFGSNSGGVEVTVTGSGALVQEVNVAPTKEASWVEHLSCFIPKEIREPWLGDLLEDRERMSSKGRSQAYIEWATGLQLLYLVLARLWAKLGWGLLIYNRLSEWFSPNK